MATSAVEADGVDNREYPTNLLLAYNIAFVFSTASTGISIVNETADSSPTELLQSCQAGS